MADYDTPIKAKQRLEKIVQDAHGIINQGDDIMFKRRFTLSGVYNYPSGCAWRCILGPFVVANVASSAINPSTDRPVTGTGVMLSFYGFYDKPDELDHALEDVKKQVATLPNIDIERFDNLIVNQDER